MYEILMHCYVIAVGFTLAGFIANLCRLITGRALSFSVPAKKYGLWVFPMVLTRIMAGPYILVRNSVRGAMIENRPIYWVAASFMIATFWSFVSGVLMIETVLRVVS
ncbi:MAG: hypothetical protein AAF228_04525 [Pseudomonadota bacterium]